MLLEIPSVLAWVIVGMLIGAIGSEFVASRGYGQGPDIVIGILGGLAAGLVASLIGLPGQPGLLLTTFAACLGAVLLTALARRLRQPAYVP